MRAPDRTFKGYVFDLDGTVYLGDHLLPGVKETLDDLKHLSKVVYLTNKPLEMPADYAAKLTRLGVEASTGKRAEAIVGKPSQRMAGALALTGATGLEEALDSADRPDYILGGLAELLPGRAGPPYSARGNGEG